MIHALRILPNGQYLAGRKGLWVDIGQGPNFGWEALFQIEFLGLRPAGNSNLFLDTPDFQLAGFRNKRFWQLKIFQG